ncbi:TonB-dependent receptor [Marinobacter sp. 1-3A]|uniref:TonB-dependent receptor plug domain-containing protein n=1 Tax=Marinobacter sp. 1-3A TaxID=2582920 RepID=UPI0019071472|nr:TonB-dependent receptor [Marinobacter sp. 1-3A]MBK1874525.1 TonB-dependent receptor [Marinobacter sp. 1-3A]
MSVTNFDKIAFRPTAFYRTNVAVMVLTTAVSLVSMDTAAQSPDGDAQLAGFYGFNDEIPEVLTTTRLRQPKTRVPGTTTVIEGEMIRDLGIMNLVEVFRLVPGMVVAEVGSNSPVTTYHGTVHYEQRRMQVLVDGRTAHRATLSDMDWQTMPVPLELIERIEVSRGPNSAAYGINAFLGTINIITRNPADTSGVEIRAIRGSRNYVRTFASIGDANDSYDWRLAFEKRKFDGFDYQSGGPDPEPFHDGHNINSFNYSSRLKVNSGFNADIRLGVVDGVNEQDKDRSGELEAVGHPDIDLRDYYLQTQLNFTPSNNHFFHILASFENYDRRQQWPIELPETAVDCLANGALLFLKANKGLCFPGSPGGIPLTAEVNADSEDSRFELELQDTLLFTDDLKLVTGIGFREDTYRSETYFNGRGNNHQSRVFGNLEYSPTTWLTLNGGGNWERTTTTDEGYFSPRVAANFILGNNHALRFVFSKAVRTPDGFEQNPDYGYTLRNVEPAKYAGYEGYRVNSTDVWKHYSYVTLGETLKEETIVSREISYFGQFPMETGQLSLEVRLFKDELRDMISGVIQFKDWTIDNNVALDQEGVEIEASLEFPGTTFRASYGYLEQDGWYTGPVIRDENGNPDPARQEYNVDLLGRMSARHSGSLALIQDLPFGIRGSSAYYWADKFRSSRFERIDFRLAKRFFQPRYSAELALTMQHYINEEPDMSSANNIADPNQLFVEAGIRF